MNEPKPNPAVPNAPPSRRRSGPWLAAALLVAGAAALLLWPLDNDYRARWYAALTDFCHVPLFAVLTYSAGRWLWPAHWVVAVVFGVLIACGAEFVQPLVGRSASWQDLLYGLAGVALAAVWLARRWPVAVRVLVSLALLAWPAERPAPIVVDAAWAAASFPVLANDGSPFESRRWYAHRAHIEREGGLLRFAFEPDQQGSSAVLVPVVRDWTRYETLEVDFSFDSPPMVILISVRDGKRLPPELPRFDLWRRYSPGRHQVRIDLAELARGGSFPPIDLAHVQSLHLVPEGTGPCTIRVHGIRLSGRSAQAP